MLGVISLEWVETLGIFNFRGGNGSDFKVDAYERVRKLNSSFSYFKMPLIKMFRTDASYGCIKDILFPVLKGYLSVKMVHKSFPV